MKVLVGLSGGVDSAIAAYLLKQQGHDVTAGFMRNWDSLTNNDILGNPTITESVCPQEQDYKDAVAVAQKLDIPILRVDFINEYWNDVFLTFLREYERGRTPNPDILCNQYIKFDAFFNYAMEHGFDAVATGHYSALREENGERFLAKASDLNKDQSYFLAQIPIDVLDRVLFPLSEIDKPEVRRIADELALDSVSHKKDSTGICFIGERNFKEFLSNYLPAKPGKIIDIRDGKELADHTGVLYYTKGQRKGLNITRYAGPWYVVSKNIDTNELYVCHESDQSLLYADSCIVDHINWLVKDPQSYQGPMQAKFRYRQPDQAVEMEMLSEHKAIVRFPQKVRSVTPGQECVFYLDGKCLGGGVIEEVFLGGENVDELVERKVREARGN